MFRQVGVAIIGAGPAGLAALAQVRKTTPDFVLIDDGGFGSVSARIGCRPSALAAHLGAKLARHRSSGGGACPTPGYYGLEPRRVAAYPCGAAAGFPLDGSDLPSGALILGEARFIGPNTLRAGGQTIRARAIVVATGAVSEVPPYWRELLGDRLLTVETLCEQRDLPESVAVVGLGPVGVQMGQVLHRLGVQVIGIESRQTVARLQDPVINQHAVGVLGGEFPLWLGAPALLEPRGERVLVRAGSRQALVERVLVAVGRRPDLARLSLAQAGCALDGRGVPLFHREHLRVGRLPIYIAGDAAGGVGGLARAVRQGQVAGYNACHRLPIAFTAGTPATMVLSEPAIAWVGPGWSALDQRFLLTGQQCLSAPDGGQGLLRVYADGRDGRVLGGAMIGPECEHLTPALARGLERELTVQQLADVPPDEAGVPAALRETCQALSRRIRPVGVNPRAPLRFMTWRGRALKAAPWAQLRQGVLATDTPAGSGVGCEAK